MFLVFSVLDRLTVSITFKMKRHKKSREKAQKVPFGHKKSRSKSTKSPVVIKSTKIKTKSTIDID